MVSELLNKLADRLAHIDYVTWGFFLGSALVCALIVYLRTVKDRSIKDFFGFMFPPEILRHPSARTDVLFWFSRRLINPLLVYPGVMIFVTAVGFATNRIISLTFGVEGPLMAGPPGPVTLALFTITMLLAYDLSYYLYHVAQHRFQFLWELHKVHHSAEVMIGLTKDRIHPLDDILNRIWDGVIPGICFGIWSVIALDLVEILVFGLNVYVIRNILMMDFVRHTHLPISLGVLDKVILSPHWHQVHHSVDPRHYNKNFGLLFSFWDQLFGTSLVPDPDEKLKFGLVDRDAKDYQSLKGLYILPLRKMWGHITRRFHWHQGSAGTQTRDVSSS